MKSRFFIDNEMYKTYNSNIFVLFRIDGAEIEKTQYFVLSFQTIKRRKLLLLFELKRKWLIYIDKVVAFVLMCVQLSTTGPIMTKMGIILDLNLGIVHKILE